MRAVEKTGKTLRQGEAVGGEHAITGTLPTLDDVIAFKEGNAAFEYGYYRYVSHPYLKRIEDQLKEVFACRHCRLASEPLIFS